MRKDFQQVWQELYEVVQVVLDDWNRPRVLILWLGLFGSVFGMVVSLVSAFQWVGPPVPYEAQVAQVEQTARNIRELITFLDTQKQHLEESQKALQALQGEHERLKPVVEADREFVDTLFRAQEERQSAGVWRERLIGFFSGIFTSFLASLLWHYFGPVLTKKKPPPEQPPPAVAVSHL